MVDCTESSSQPFQITKRSIARWLALLLGIPLGLLRFGMGLFALFALKSLDTWLSVSTGAAFYFALLPLTVLGFFSPRFSGIFLVLDSLAIFIGYICIEGPKTVFLSGDLSLQFFFLDLMPTLIVGYLFLFCSTRLREIQPKPNEPTGG